MYLIKRIWTKMILFSLIWTTAPMTNRCILFRSRWLDIICTGIKICLKMQDWIRIHRRQHGMNGRKMQLRLLMQTRMFTVREFLMIMLIRLHISCSDLEDLRLQMTTETGKLILKAMQDMKNS